MTSAPSRVEGVSECDFLGKKRDDRGVHNP